MCCTLKRWSNGIVDARIGRQREFGDVLATAIPLLSREGKGIAVGTGTRMTASSFVRGGNSFLGEDGHLKCEAVLRISRRAGRYTYVGTDLT